MAAADIVQSVKMHLYGAGVGESPAIVQAAADASETISAPTVTFTMESGHGVIAGDILSTLGSDEVGHAFCFYVLSVATDVLTCVAQYRGGPLPEADDMDGMLFEVNANVPEHLIWDKVETIIDTYLWPDVWKYNTRSLTPDISTYQNEVPVEVEEIERAQQQYGDIWIDIPFSLVRGVHRMCRLLARWQSSEPMMDQQSISSPESVTLRRTR